jgi:hypothetical protein
MPLARTRALGICALLAIPAAAFAQTPRSATIFSPSAQMGTVNVRAALVTSDFAVKPLALLKIVARRADRPDSMSVQTDLDGRVSLHLRVGTYTVRAKTPQPVAGRSYSWSVQVVVRPSRNQNLQLTNANADSTASAPVVVASAPVAMPPVTKPAPSPAAERPAVQKPMVEKPATEQPAENPFSVPAAANPPRAAIPQPVPTPMPAAQAPAPVPAPVLARSAQPATPRANTSKLILGLSLNGSTISSEELTTSRESGAGLSAQLGWGFTKNFSIVLDASAARIESIDGNFDLAHVDVSGRWDFVSRSHGFVPFLEVGYSGRAAGKQDVVLFDDAGNAYNGDLTILGSGLSLGGGMEYFIAPKWALGGTFKWTTGQFTQVKFDNVTVDGLALDATSARFNLGFSWYPMGR